MKWFFAPAAVFLSLSPAAFAVPTIVEPGWYLAEEYVLAEAIAARRNPADGRIYAGSRNVGSTAGIYVFDASGVPTLLVSADYIGGITIAADGDLFFSKSAGGDSIYRLPLGSTTASLWVSGFHAGDDDPVGLDIAPPNHRSTWILPGEALVADLGQSNPAEIWKWSPDVAEGETAAHTDDGTLTEPTDVAIGASRVWVLDDGAAAPGAIYELRSGGALTPLTTSEPLDQPTGIDVDPSNQDLIVGDDGRVVRVNERTGDVSEMFTGFSPPLLWGCVEVLDHGNAILVTDRLAARIYLFRRQRTTCLGAPFATIDNPNPVAYTNYGQLVAADGNQVYTHTSGSGSSHGIYELQPDGMWNVVGGCSGCITAEVVDLAEGRYALGRPTSGTGAVYVGTSLSFFDGLFAFSGSSQGVTGFGAAICLTGDELFVGAPSDTDGHVFVYSFDPGVPEWTFDYEITLPTWPTPQVGGISPNFGFSIACDGDTLLIGAPGVDDVGPEIDRGAAYFYKRDPGTGQWVLAQEHFSGIVDDGQQFGYDVAVSGSAAVIGAPFTDDAPGLENGYVNVQHLDPVTGTWMNVESIFGGESGIHYGMKVDISDTSLVIGAPDDTVGGLAQAGSVFFWQRTAPDNWTYLSAAWGTEVGERVGISFALTDDDLLLVGLPYTDVGPDVDAGLVAPIYLGDCPDCNADLLPDTIQIGTGLADTDDDAILDACEPIQNASAGTIHPTIQNAIDEAIVASQDQIGIPAGAYVESFIIDRHIGIIAQSPADPPRISAPTSVAAATIDNGALVSLRYLDFGDAAAKAAPGSAILVKSGSLTAQDLNITGHTSGGATLLGGSATFLDCRFVGNTNDLNSIAILAFDAAQLTVERCAFIGNSGTDGAGPAIFAIDTPLTVNDSLFLGNHIAADGPPGISCFEIWSTPQTNIVSCTFLENTTDAGQSVVKTDLTIPATITDCLFWQNGTLAPVLDVNAISDVSYCLAPIPLPGTGNVAGDPLFVENPDPGPDTIWGTADDTGDPTPGIGSPAIDAGGSQAYFNATFHLPIAGFDLNGNSRAVDNPDYPNTGDPSFGAIDIGALEAPANTPPPCPCVGNLDETCSTDVFDFGIFATNFGATGLTPNTGGDFDGDGDVDVFDFGVFAPDFGCLP